MKAVRATLVKDDEQNEKEQYSFAGRPTGMRPGADVYEDEDANNPSNTGAWTVGNRTDPMPANQEDIKPVRATLVNETPGDEAEEAGSMAAVAAVGRKGIGRVGNDGNGTTYPDRHPDRKHPADDTITGGLGNHVHPSGDGGRYHDGSAGGGEEADGARGEISQLLTDEKERSVHHDKGLSGDDSQGDDQEQPQQPGQPGAKKNFVPQDPGPELPEKPQEPSDETPGSGRTKPVQAEWYKGGDEPESPHEDDEKAHDVPTDSFKDDIRRKLSIRRVMPGGAGQDMKDQPAGQKADEGEQDDSVDKDQRGVPVPAEPVWSKEETNYRYAADPQRSCGDCRFFVEPAACKLVMGMILKTDTCDRFEPEQKNDDKSVRASLATESVREAWTDEARAASAAARQRGYKVKNADNYGKKLQHPDGHQLEIRRDGNWTHREMSPAGAFVNRASGVGSIKLAERLRDLHGPVPMSAPKGDLYVTDKSGRSTGSLKQKYADMDRDAGVRGKYRDRSTPMSEAWSDEARAAALLARRAGYKPMSKDQRHEYQQGGGTKFGTFYRHPDGHVLKLYGDASHSLHPSFVPGKTNPGTPSRLEGQGSKDLAKNIDRAHVKPSKESQSGGKGKIGPGTTILGNQRQVPQTKRRVPSLGFSKDEDEDEGQATQWGMNPGGKGYAGMREYSPDQPRDKGRFTKGSQPGDKTTSAASAKSHAVKDEYQAKLAALRQKNAPVDRKSQQQGRGLSQDEGRQIFSKAGKDAGYKESKMRETWSDNARAAAALARSANAKGFEYKTRKDQGQVSRYVYEHPQTGERIEHTVGAKPQGSSGGANYDHWSHMSPIEGKPKGNWQFIAKGQGSDELDKHLGSRGTKESRTIDALARRLEGRIALREVGWTDEARAAAAIARQKGYKQKGVSSAGSPKFEHPNGHKLLINRAGEWGHQMAQRSPTSGETLSWGKGADALAGRLADLHGPGTYDPTKSDRAPGSAGSDVALKQGKYQMGLPKKESTMRETWSDEARAAAAEARRANMAGKGGHIGKGKFSKGQLVHVASTIQQSNTPNKADVAAHFADSMGETNPAFNRDKFIAAATGDRPIESGKPAMQRAHYETLAGTISSLPSGDKEHMANEFGRALKGTNERFDGDRFARVASGSAKRESFRRAFNMEGVMREGGKLPYYALHKNGEAIGMNRLLDIKRGMEAIGYESPLGEVAPPGWEGSVKAMKKGKGIDNPYALAWYMKGKGYSPHKEVDGDELYGGNKSTTVRQQQLDKGQDQPLPGKRNAGKLHPADKSVAKNWNKGDSDLADRQDDRLGKEDRFEMTQPEGRADSTALGKEDRLNKQRVASRGQYPGQRGGKAVEADVIERQARREADVIRRTTRRLIRENDYAGMRRLDKPVRESKRDQSWKRNKGYR